jgi:hypothetical protein
MEAFSADTKFLVVPHPWSTKNAAPNTHDLLNIPIVFVIFFDLMYRLSKIPEFPKASIWQEMAFYPNIWVELQ